MATTVSCVVSATVACGEVVLHETLPEVLVHEYQLLPDASWIFTVPADVGEMAGIDVMSGGNGNDYIVGGGCADTIDGGGGNDVCIGGPGLDAFLLTCETQIQ